MSEPFVDAQTVAGFLGVTDRWVREHASPSLAAPHRLPVYEIGAHLRFRLSEVEQWVAARRRGCEPASNVVSLRKKQTLTPTHWDKRAARGDPCVDSDGNCEGCGRPSERVTEGAHAGCAACIAFLTASGEKQKATT